jgi:3-hydroxyacyl-CoA dehydrogenase
MHANTEISRVAIVGTGLIGGSWAACFLAHGLDVVATYPAPGVEKRALHIRKEIGGHAANRLQALYREVAYLTGDLVVFHLRSKNDPMNRRSTGPPYE